MNVTATNEPCMILETVELLYAFINELPAGELTAPGPYTIPSSELQNWTCGKRISPKCSELRANIYRTSLAGTTHRRRLGHDGKGAARMHWSATVTISSPALSPSATKGGDTL